MTFIKFLPNTIKNDLEYLNIVYDILENDEFSKLIDTKHHGFNRFNHVLSVSYTSYLYAKDKNLDYKKLARMGLLHDFFTEDSNYISIERMMSIFLHPNKSVKNSLKYFKLTNKEINMIKAHMFPITFTIPTSKEAFILIYFDKKMAILETLGVIRSNIKILYELNQYIHASI